MKPSRSPKRAERLFRAAALAALLAATALPRAEARAPERCLFVSTIQEPPVLSSRQAIEDLARYAERAGVKTLFVQVYRENKSWVPTTVGDSSPYEECRRQVGEDPFALLIREAHARGVEVHAWLNLMSIGANANAPLLRKYGPEILTRNVLPKASLEEYKIDNQYFLEPGDPRVQDAMAQMVTEVVRGYPELDGVQFDYIRYPDWHPKYGHTAVNEARFKEATGLASVDDDGPAWKDWKRAQVTALLDRLGRAARAEKPGIHVSTTGLVPYSRAFHEASQDWKLWVGSGRAEFVTLMCYSASTLYFERCVKDARKQLGSLERANIAVGAYKLVRSPRAFRHQMKDCLDSDPRACAVFHYGSLLENPSLEAAVKKPSK